MNKTYFLHPSAHNDLAQRFTAFVPQCVLHGSFHVAYPSAVWNLQDSKLVLIMEDPVNQNIR